MWSNQSSLRKTVRQYRNQKPPYCPNPLCQWHDPQSGESGQYASYGSRPISRYPYFTKRYRCKSCRKVFSSSIFTINYRDRIKDNYEEIFDLYHGGFSRRETARFLDCSLDTILRRFSKLAQQALIQQAYLTRKLEIQESVAYDGIENFSYSQYDPNNINHAVGRESLFCYDFNFAPLNRKGRTSARQIKRKKQLEEEFGKYPKNAIHNSSHRIFSRLIERVPKNRLLELHTDNHYAYRDVISCLPSRKRIAHIITPAKLARNYRNRLFAINHIDLLTRHNSAAFRRETIAFSKHPIAMVESFGLLMIRKNFMRPIFYKKHVRDPQAHLESPAMRLGIAKKIMNFNNFFSMRLTETQVQLNRDWEQFVRRIDPTARRKIRQYRLN